MTNPSQVGVGAARPTPTAPGTASSAQQDAFHNERCVPDGGWCKCPGSAHDPLAAVEALCDSWEHPQDDTFISANTYKAFGARLRAALRGTS